MHDQSIQKRWGYLAPVKAGQNVAHGALLKCMLGDSLLHPDEGLKNVESFPQELASIRTRHTFSSDWDHPGPQGEQLSLDQGFLISASRRKGKEYVRLDSFKLPDMKRAISSAAYLARHRSRLTTKDKDGDNEDTTAEP